MAMGRACDLPLRRHALIKPYGNQKGAWRFAYCVRAMQECQGFSVTTPIRDADFIACQIQKLASNESSHGSVSVGLPARVSATTWRAVGWRTTRAGKAWAGSWIQGSPTLRPSCFQREEMRSCLECACLHLIQPVLWIGDLGHEKF